LPWVAIGLGLSYWETMGDSKSKVIKWFGLVRCIRALKCVSSFSRFINVNPVADMMAIGRAGSIGWKTVRSP
jgi:hypothetical protein